MIIRVPYTLMSHIRSQRRLIAIFPLFILLMLSVSFECHAVGPRENGLHTLTGEQLPINTSPEQPCCPLDDHDHADVDHCASCLHCACNVPLMALETLLTYAPSLSRLTPFNRSNQLPEVYLTIFIPPQNLV
jgi:hypothetical protein